MEQLAQPELPEQEAAPLFAMKPEPVVPARQELPDQMGSYHPPQVPTQVQAQSDRLQYRLPLHQ